VRWRSAKNDSTNGGYTGDSLQRIFDKVRMISFYVLRGINLLINYLIPAQSWITSVLKSTVNNFVAFFSGHS